MPQETDAPEARLMNAQDRILRTKVVVLPKAGVAIYFPAEEFEALQRDTEARRSSAQAKAKG